MTWPPQATRAEVLRILETNREFDKWVISREETKVVLGLLRGEEIAMRSRSALEWAEEWLAGKESLADMLERFAIHEIAVWRREHEATITEGGGGGMSSDAAVDMHEKALNIADYIAFEVVPLTTEQSAQIQAFIMKHFATWSPDRENADLTARLASAEDQYRRDLAELANTSVSDDTYDAVVVERDALKAAVEQAHERTRTIMDAFRGCPDHVYQHDGCVMCEGRGQTIDRMVAALTSAAGGRK